MKAALRSEKLLERLDHHPVEKAQKDFLIAKKISELPDFRKARMILMYFSIKGEVDIAKLLKDFGAEKIFVAPRIEGDLLELYKIKNLEDVERGTFQISEPKKHLPKIPFSDIDLVLVPGVVFARNGHRIGYGKGFYDRTLRKLSCPKIGIAYDFQMVKNIRGELHDVPMDVIVTEREVVSITN